MSGGRKEKVFPTLNACSLVAARALFVSHIDNNICFAGEGETLESNRDFSLGWGSISLKWT